MGGGGAGVYSYIHVHIPEKQSLSKEIRRAEHEYMNIHPPPPPPHDRAMNGPVDTVMSTSSTGVLRNARERLMNNLFKMAEAHHHLRFYLRFLLNVLSWLLSAMTFEKFNKNGHFSKLPQIPRKLSRPHGVG